MHQVKGTDMLVNPMTERERNFVELGLFGKIMNIGMMDVGFRGSRCLV
jgi:hypothetical protein